MTPERWRRVESLFQEAVTQDPGQREAWLESACAGDVELLNEVRNMIAADEQDGFEEQQIGAAAAALAERPLSAAPSLRAGPYRLTQLLGRGGMGAVYLGERADGQYEAEVAVKLIHAGMDTTFFLSRFRRERQALARLQHPNIARILDSGTTDTGLPYIVMELVRGVPITTHVKDRQLTRDQILALYIEVCRAVSHAHQKFIVHRDLKPGNILVEENGTPKLLDFGVCKLIEDAPRDTDALTAAHLLTPEYASPEQVRGDAITVTSDVYSLGVILYELLTGRPPRVIAKMTPAAIAAAAEETIPAPSQLMKDTGGGAERGGHFDAIVMKALHNDPARRYQSVDLFAEDLLRLLNRQRPLAGDTWGPERDPSRLKRRLVVAGLTAAALGGGVFAWRRNVARKEAVDVSKLPLFLEAHRLLKANIRDEKPEDRLKRAQRAVELFEQAANEYPDSARIQAGLAEAYEGIADDVPGKYYDYMRLCRTASERGLQLDDRLDDLHHTMGTALLFGSWEIEKALAAFTRAVHLNPRRGRSHRLRAEVLCMFGRFEEALVALGAAQATSPLDVDIGAEKAAVYFRWHRFAQAAEAAKQTLAIESDNELARWVLGLVLEHQGAVDEAEKIYRSLPFRPVRHPIALAHLLAATGRVKEAEEIIEKMRKVAPHPSAEALIYAVMGDRERALQLLEQAYKDRDMNVLFVSMDPRYDLLRREPRFQKICKQLGLPARG